MICAGCKQEIDTKNERYTHVEDWAKEVLVNDSWWHLKCFGKAMNRDVTLLEKKAALMLEKAGSIINNLPPELLEKREEFVI